MVVVDQSTPMYQFMPTPKFIQNHHSYTINYTCTASRRNLAQLGHKNLIFACFKCNFGDFFLLKYQLTQAQVIQLFY